ncbi:helix-hairpin-helix domain-containing protein [Deinococcus sp.]|uniref:ComEA family DNA-binding protein n=1 Tax=Deinococcus sp. TaxID=47478 RepID=UPI0025D109A0|nr:helix-hairpin-helix domain-containing protein [Deinococcus sp.]
MRKPVTLLIAAALLLAPTAFAKKTPTTATPSAATTMPAKPAGAAMMVNINTASAADLAKLPGVSAKIAADIIKNRPYKTEAELVTKVKGIGPKNVKKMSSMLSY